jgi:hypothetical protein
MRSHKPKFAWRDPASGDYYWKDGTTIYHINELSLMSLFQSHGYWEIYGIPFLYDYALSRNDENLNL